MLEGLIFFQYSSDITFDFFEFKNNNVQGFNFFKIKINYKEITSWLRLSIM